MEGSPKKFIFLKIQFHILNFYTVSLLTTMPFYVHCTVTVSAMQTILLCSVHSQR